jgi:hypothetical protein
MTVPSSIAAALSRAIGDYFRATLDPEPYGISLSAPESEEDRRRREALAAAPIPDIDIPPTVVQSFAERVDALVLVMDKAVPAIASQTRRVPENMVETLVWDMAGDDRFVGHLFIDAATGREVKLVTPDDRTVWL